MATNHNNNGVFEAHLPMLPLNDANQAKYYCGRCEGWYLDEETLIEHVNLYHEYWCTLCFRKLKSENDLKQHLTNIHCIQNRCSSCRIVFLSPESALKHMLDKHSQIKDKLTPVVENPPQLQRVSTKHRSHAALRQNAQFLCAKCNLTFSNIPDTKKHMRDEHKTEIGVRQCPTTGQEEIFIYNNKGRVFNTKSSHHVQSKDKQLTFNGGETTLTITKNGTNRSAIVTEPPPPSISITRNTNSLIIPTKQIPRASTSSNWTPPVQNRITLVNANPLISNSPAPNGFYPTYVSTPAPPKLQRIRSRIPRQCEHCDKILSSSYSLQRHLSTVHKPITQNIQTTLKIDRVLSRSEIEAFEPHATSFQDDELPTLELQTPTNETEDSSDTVHVEVVMENDDDVEVIATNASNDPPIDIEDDDDSDMDIQVISEPTPRLPKPLPFIRAQPSKRFLRNLVKKNLRPARQGLNREDIAAKIRKLNGHLALQKSITTRR